MLVGCFTATERDARQLQPLPEAYSTGETSAPQVTTLPWWDTFKRDDLNALQEQAFSENLDLVQAWARLRQSEARARQAGADLYAQADLSAGYRRDWRESGQNTAESNYATGVNVSYEVDLWGKIRAGQSAAAVNALAVAEDVESTALTLSASVADRWIEIIAAHTRLDLLEEQLEVNATQLELVELRFKTAQASSLDVYQQRQTLARTRSQIPSVEAELELSKNALNLLLGRSSVSPLNIKWEHAPELPKSPKAGVPSDLLEQRPDIRAARLRLESADWNVAAAKADRLPRLAITASAGTGSDQFEDIFDNWLANLAANITGPILDGGRRKAEVDVQMAAAEEALAAYRSAVLNAYREVEDALLLEQKVSEQLEATRRELGLARRTLTEARNRYANGLSDYLNVTSALVSVQGLERDEITLVAGQYRARISLHQALGGQVNTF